MKLEVRPATRRDLIEYFGDDLPDLSFFAFLGEYAGNIVLVGGLALGRIPIAFMDYRDGIQDILGWKRAMVKGSGRVMDYARKHHRTIYTTPRDGVTSPLFLSHFGFKVVAQHDGGDIYKWVNSECQG